MCVCADLDGDGRCGRDSGGWRGRGAGYPMRGGGEGGYGPAEMVKGRGE